MTTNLSKCCPKCGKGMDFHLSASENPHYWSCPWCCYYENETEEKPTPLAGLLSAEEIFTLNESTEKHHKSEIKVWLKQIQSLTAAEYQKEIAELKSRRQESLREYELALRVTVSKVKEELQADHQAKLEKVFQEIKNSPEWKYNHTSLLAGRIEIIFNDILSQVK